jgi:hypothetical protein
MNPTHKHEIKNLANGATYHTGVESDCDNCGCVAGEVIVSDCVYCVDCYIAALKHGCEVKNPADYVAALIAGEPASED